jgi:hypothetical protein
VLGRIVRHAPARFPRAFLAALSAVFLGMACSAARADNPIVDENALPGTTAWQLVDGLDIGGCPNDSCSWTLDARRGVEGYASPESADHGDTIRIYVSCDEASYTLRVFRIGWYGGAGGRQVFGPVTLPGRFQLAPAPDPAFGTVECRWGDPYLLAIPPDWVSGAYLATLTAANTFEQSYVPFVVRDHDRPADLLVQLPTSTWQAYNCWGGRSLYGFNSIGCQAAQRVSYDRPYSNGFGAGDFFFYAIQAIRFFEREGYDVTYCTSTDLHSNPGMLRSRRAFISLSHDEYWSWPMRSHLEEVRDSVSMAFLGANTCFWQVRFEPSTTGVPLRMVVSYKERANEDPLLFDGVPGNDHLVTTQWRWLPVNWHEAGLVGVAYDGDMQAEIPTDIDMIVTGSPPWLFENTGLAPGDTLPMLVGHEMDRRYPSSVPYAVVAASSPVYIPHPAFPEYRGDAEMTVAETSSNIIFATGTLQWSWGLDDCPLGIGHIPRVHPGAQQMMRNVLDRMISLELPPLDVAPGEKTLPLVAWPVPFRGGSLHLSLEVFRGPESVAITIHDVAGRRLRSLAAPGGRSTLWDGRDDNGLEVASGLVWIRAVRGEQVRATRVLVIR